MSNAVEIKSLRKTYGKVVALDNLSLDIPQKAVFGLLGPNGAGKSTTFGLMAGWLKPTKGEVQVLGLPSHQLAKLRGAVSALPQDSDFPPALAVESQLRFFSRLMGMSPKESRLEASRVLEQVGLANSGKAKSAHLSHGMLKRIGIAQALLGNPQLVLLDEPTAGLDPASARQVKDIIVQLGQNATVVVSSHNLVDIQEVCTHGAILDHGKLTASGTIDELTDTGAQIQILVESQNELPLRVLGETFGDAHVDTKHQAGHGAIITITFDRHQKSSDITAQALRILLEHKVAIIEVHRGKSLETAYMELTT
ncbi:MAG: ABC transporter ATP-binding protein [Myxococcales bacterium]|nr:ABC transporter ATP-binding protein [Myxococcales bacterium]|tara:strand:- start:367 stop:1296 length:930 start_codon:yes stop_codon:yes gene_type:complete